MSKTPRTDAAHICLKFSTGRIKRIDYVTLEFARQLELELAEALDGWAKQTEMYEAAVKERDEWKQCAEELAKDMRAYNPTCERQSLFRFNKLKGKTK
jgi:hypothetical protein